MKGGRVWRPAWRYLIRRVGRRRLLRWLGLTVAAARSLTEEAGARAVLPRYTIIALEANLDAATDGLTKWPETNESTPESRLRMVQ